MSTSSKPNIPPPPQPTTKRRLLASAPLPQFAPDNLTRPTDEGVKGLKDMNFKVDPTFHRRFKMEATARSMSSKQLLEACFQAYLERHGHRGND